MLHKLGMGSEGTRTVEGKNEAWQQSRELEIKSLGSLATTTATAQERQRTTTLHVHHAFFFTFLCRRRTTTT